MHLQIVTRRTLDGVDASVPSIRECETWAATEDEALDKLLELVRYFLQLKPGFKHGLDRSRREGDETYYTLVVPER
jgi:hypothetical protein